MVLALEGAELISRNVAKTAKSVEATNPKLVLLGLFLTAENLCAEPIYT